MNRNEISIEQFEAFAQMTRVLAYLKSQRTGRSLNPAVALNRAIHIVQCARLNVLRNK